MNYQDFVIRIVVCFILSFIIGLERHLRGRAIGLRTNVLVCLGAFLFVSMAINVPTKDEVRMAAQVVSGIGFLGAGVILRDGTNIRGLNTAATLWCNAAIGVMCASGILVEAAIGTFLILLSNIFLRYLSRNLIKYNRVENSNKNYIIKVVCNDDKELTIRSIIMQYVERLGLVLNHMESKDVDTDKTKLYATITSVGAINTIEKLIGKITIEPGVSNVGFKMEEINNKNIDDDDNE
ncbi:MAG: MgtC/SapB family protein [Bacilli bacterium]